MCTTPRATERALRFYERSARADPRDDTGRHNLVWGARAQLYGALAFTAVLLVAVGAGAILLFGKTAAWFVFIMAVTGIAELVKHRTEVLAALTPTAREVSKLRR